PGAEQPMRHRLEHRQGDRAADDHDAQMKPGAEEPLQRPPISHEQQEDHEDDVEDHGQVSGWSARSNSIEPPRTPGAPGKAGLKTRFYAKSQSRKVAKKKSDLA